MTPLRPACLVLAALSAAGCAGPRIVPAAPIDGTVSGRCHVDRVRGAVGLAASDATLERARIDSDSTELRVVRGSADRPASATLPEPTPEAAGGPRLTVETGAHNAITGMRCD